MGDSRGTGLSNFRPFQQDRGKLAEIFRKITSVLRACQRMDIDQFLLVASGGRSTQTRRPDPSSRRAVRNRDGGPKPGERASARMDNSIGDPLRSDRETPPVTDDTEFLIPAGLVRAYRRSPDENGRDWLAALPVLVGELLDRWKLRVDGAPMHGWAALVLPVVDARGQAAVLKVQPVDDETVGEPLALRAWDGRGAVRLLRHDPESGSMLLERLDARRSLGCLDDDLAALEILAGCLGQLHAVAAPPGMRQLADVAAATLDRVERTEARMGDPNDRWLLRRCAEVVNELLPERGDRLLHWDLHYDNVLAAHPHSGREPWIAIDPKPLAGHPGFDLLPALHNRWDDVVATGDVPQAVRRRFDIMTGVLDLDRQRAAGWTLGRVLQQLTWESGTESANPFAAADRAIARALLGAH